MINKALIKHSQAGKKLIGLFLLAAFAINAAAQNKIETPSEINLIRSSSVSDSSTVSVENSPDVQSNGLIRYASKDTDLPTSDANEMQQKSSSQKFTSVNSRHKIGFMTSYGSQDFIGVPYDYRVSFFQAQYYYTLLQKKTWSLEVLVQPQYNTTRYRHIDKTENGYEVGVNAGLLVRKELIKDDLNAYIFLSSGPHYISGAPQRQVPGFIFSDNLFVGLNTKIAPGLDLDLRSGFRHISNANFKKPNSGVNNFIFSIGFAKKL